MNRLSFLKTLGVGIAAAVIVPKILAEMPDKKPEIDLAKPPYYDDLKSQYGHYEEDFLRKTKPFINDVCLDRDGRSWLVVSIYGTITLYAFEPLPKPNCVEVKEENFSEYFVVLGSCFLEGTGQPS